MPITLPDARQLSDDVLEALRLRAVRGRELGYTEADLADLLGVARETVCRWWSAYQADGVDALPGGRPGRPVGSGRLLSDDQADNLRLVLRTTAPEDHRIAAPLWTRRAVQELIHRTYGVTVAIRTVGLYLHRWGFTPQHPVRHARAQDPEEVDQWLTEIYPAIADRAADEGATIYWCDEVGVAADECPARGYAPIGHPPTVDVPGPHVRASQIAAITPTGAVRFMTYSGTMTAAVFLVFLGRLVRSTPGKVFLIADQLRAHLTPEVVAWVAARTDRIEVFTLPRYAPERNPVEYLNHDLKEQVNATGLPDTRPEVRSRMQAFMQKVLHLPEHVMNYFQHPCVQYASAMNA